MLFDAKIPIGYIVKHIRADVVRVLLISIFFHLLKLALSTYLPLIPLQLPTIPGSMISLLLAFKTSQSYDRWWEASKIWSTIINDSRTLVLQVRTFLPHDYRQRPGPDAPLPVLAYRQMAWCYCLGQALRGLDPAAGLAPYLSAAELAGLALLALSLPEPMPRDLLVGITYVMVIFSIVGQDLPIGPLVKRLG